MGVEVYMNKQEAIDQLERIRTILLTVAGCTSIEQMEQTRMSAWDGIQMIVNVKRYLEDEDGK